MRFQFPNFRFSQKKITQKRVMGAAASIENIDEKSNKNSSSKKYEDLIQSLPEDRAKAILDAVERSSSDGNGSTLTEIQTGIFRLLQGAAYRSYHVYFAANFHTHSKVKSLPYTFPNFVKFVEATIELYKSLNVVPESTHSVLDDLVKECRDELSRVEKRIEEFSLTNLSEAQKVVHDKLIAERAKNEDTREDFKEKIQAAVFKSHKKLHLTDAAQRLQRWKVWYEDEKEDEKAERLKREKEMLNIEEGFSSNEKPNEERDEMKFLQEWRRVIMNSYDEKINGAMVKIEWWYV